MLLCVLFTLCAALLLGAITLQLASGLPRPVAFGLAVACAALFALALPLSLSRLVPASTWPRTALASNLALIAFALLAAPKTSRMALEQHGGWMIGQGSVSGLRWLAAHIPRSQAPAALRKEAPAAQPAKAAPSAAPSAPPPRLPDQPQSPEQIFELRSPAVVTIAARRPIAEGTPGAGFFAELGIRDMPVSGGGFLVSDDGLVVTSHQLIDDAASVEITLADGRRFDRVTVEHSDVQHDLALLRIDAQGLPRVPLAGSEKLAPGVLAVAVGNLLGLDLWLTDGIVSNTRNIAGTTFVQTQPALAPGCAGAPLFDDRGRVIGVNTAAKGAGPHLAVFVAHVHDLLAAPRSPRALERYPKQARLGNVKVNGAVASSLDLMAIEQGLQLLALAGEGCVRQVPGGAELTLAYPVNKLSGMPGRQAAMSSNLAAEDDKCLKRAIDLLGRALAVALVRAYPARITKREGIELEFLLEGLPVKADTPAAPLQVQVRVAKPD